MYYEVMFQLTLLLFLGLVKKYIPSALEIFHLRFGETEANCCNDCNNAEGWTTISENDCAFLFLILHWTFFDTFRLSCYKPAQPTDGDMLTKKINRDKHG